MPIFVHHENSTKKNWITILNKNDIEQTKRIAKLDFDFFWLEYEDLNFEKLATRSCKKLMNSYCIRKGLIRKCQLSYYLKKCKKEKILFSNYILFKFKLFILF